MNDEKIIVVINEDGGIVAETSGFHGPACIQALEELLCSLGDEAGRKTKDEYYEEKKSSAIAVQRGAR